MLPELSRSHCIKLHLRNVYTAHAGAGRGLDPNLMHALMGIEFDVRSHRPVSIDNVYRVLMRCDPPVGSVAAQDDLRWVTRTPAFDEISAEAAFEHAKDAFRELSQERTNEHEFGESLAAVPGLFRAGQQDEAAAADATALNESEHRASAE